MGIESDDPILNRLCRKHRVTRGIDQLIGLCQGVMLDGHVSEDEARLLMTWLEANSELIDQWPASVIYRQLDAAFADNTITPEESGQILKTLLEITDGLHAQPDRDSQITTLPLTRPAPEVIFPGKSFVLTGTFVCGKRADLSNLVGQIGGTLHKTVQTTTDYLVIGDKGSSNWRHASFGAKIFRAMELVERGQPIAIIGEEHWYNALPAGSLD